MTETIDKQEKQLVVPKEFLIPLMQTENNTSIPTVICCQESRYAASLATRTKIAAHSILIDNDI